jgi:dUTP pyrophosphatase
MPQNEDAFLTHMSVSQTGVPPVAIKSLPHRAGLPVPAYQTAGSAGMDLAAAVAEDQPVWIAPGARALIPTGLQIALPSGFEAQIRPRSGLALKEGVTCLNTPGTIDSDYRGEIGVLLINHGEAEFQVTRGMRVAQMVIAPVLQVELYEVADLPVSMRGEGGFGSTGRTKTPKTQNETRRQTQQDPPSETKAR